MSGTNLQHKTPHPGSSKVDDFDREIAASKPHEQSETVPEGVDPAPDFDDDIPM